MKKFIDLQNQKKHTVTLDKPGKYIVFCYNYSGTVEIVITAEKIDVDIVGLFIGQSKDTFTLNTVQHHTSPNSISNLLVHGIFDDQAQFNYEGLIRIDKHAQMTHAYQQNKNIVLSEKAHIESKPFLEIEANDVFCTHGSTTGHLPQEQIYYLQNRGIASERGERLLLKGFANAIFEVAEKYEFGKEISEYKKEAAAYFS